MKNIALTIVVLSHNRPKYIKQCLDSILSQDYKHFRLIVSENSTDEETNNVIIEHFPDIEINRRIPSLPFVQHYNKVLNELETEYTMLFHDDDFFIRNDALSDMMKYFTDGVVAVAGNAYHLYGNVTTEKKFFESDDPFKELKSPKEIFRLDLRGEIAPYPSYIYRTVDLLKVKSDWVKFGKYNDGYIMSSLGERGKVIWVTNPVMNYRIHDSNDSQKMDIPALKSLIQYGYDLGLEEKEIALYYFPTMLLISLREKSTIAFLRAVFCYLKYPIHITNFLVKRFLRRYSSFFAVLKKVYNQK